MLDAALWYASQGVKVFPLVRNEKRPASPRGFHDATTDAAQIRRWWEQGDPEFNIGSPTGELYDIVDVDTAEGAKAIRAWVDRGDFPRVFGVVNTPKYQPNGVGVHYMIAPTGLGRAPGFLPGVDGLGTDGYSVLPPSVVDGKRYRFEMTPEWEMLRG